MTCAPTATRTRDLPLTVRISHRTRAWFNGSRRGGPRVWSARFGVLGGGGDGDVEAEGVELAEVGADLAVAVGFAFVPVGAEVGEPGFRVGKQVPDDGQDGAADGAFGPVPAQAPRQAAEPFAEEGLGAGGAVGGLGAVALEVGVALSFPGFAVAGAGLAGDGG